jgi:hypothetical protein
MPSFSSTRSFILSMVSLGSISISISFPVSVFTLIIMPPLLKAGRKKKGGGDMKGRGLGRREEPPPYLLSTIS